MKIGAIKILVSNCITGVYLRWWFNGWHYFNFIDGYQIIMESNAIDIQVTNFYSRISKTERATAIKSVYKYQVELSNIAPENLPGFVGMLLSERVEQYENSTWYKINLTRGDHIIQDPQTLSYYINFELTRNDRSLKSTVYQNIIKLYIGDTLCDLDDDEIIAINKQVNDIAEMQDRQSDFTYTFKIQKSRAMITLFELTGEVGANTDFPYRLQPCTLIQEGIIIINNGNLIIDNKDDDYYYVSIYSGNISFFKTIDNLKLKDLTLASADHTWNQSNAEDSQNNDWDFVYPVMEPSDDGGLCPLTDDGVNVDLYAGWIWPFIKCKVIWDEIFANARYTPSGDIYSDPLFPKLHMPIATTKIDYLKIADYLFNVHAINNRSMTGGVQDLCWGYPSGICKAQVTSYKGNSIWRYSSLYTTPFAGTFTFRVICYAPNLSYFPIHIYMYAGVVLLGTMSPGGFTSSMVNGHIQYARIYSMSYACLSGWDIHWTITYCLGLAGYAVEVTNIDAPKIAYGSSVPVHNHLPEMSQTDFIKMICNIFGLVPEANPRDKTIYFWNYNKLYENIPNARDWSKYLSEKDDNVGFKFGDYAQNNLMKFNTSDDVKSDTGTGIMQIDDETLEKTKDIIELPVSTCDEVIILTDVNVSRINMNKYNPDTNHYDPQDSIDPRITVIDRINELSPPKTFGIRSTYSPGDPGSSTVTVTNPKKSSSIEMAFASRSSYYNGLARMLDHTKMRSCKFNLPAFEVAGFRHYIPIYLSQYRAYFYVNIISSYVYGQLCTIDLIKL